MFDYRKEVPSLELCVKLKELGFPQTSPGWYWDIEVKRLVLIWAEVVLKDLIKAPTVVEMGEWLPLFLEEDADKGISFAVEVDGLHLWKTYDNKGWAIAYRDRIQVASTLVEVFAKMLIWLVENGCVSFKKED